MTADNEDERFEEMELEGRGVRTLDAPTESLAGAMARAGLWAVVFLEMILIYGVRP